MSNAGFVLYPTYEHFSLETQLNVSENGNAAKPSGDRMLNDVSPAGLGH
jgi:hypothetical protein